MVQKEGALTQNYTVIGWYDGSYTVGYGSAVVSAIIEVFL